VSLYGRMSVIPDIKNSIYVCKLDLYLLTFRGWWEQ
jgi:hypothetical protein